MSETPTSSLTIPRFNIMGIDVNTMAAMIHRAYEIKLTERGHTLDSSIDVYINKAAQWLISSNKCGLILNGGVGNGKTTLARAMRYTLTRPVVNAHWAYPNKGSIQFITATDLSALAIHEWGKYMQLKQYPALIIDELCTEDIQANSFGTRMMPIVDLLHYRYDYQLFTICTTNVSRGEFGEFYGHRIADRAKEMFDWLTFKTKSYR